MFETLEIMAMARGLATHAGQRQAVIAENIANADTPGYRSQDIADFADSFRALGDGAPIKATRSGHLTEAGEPRLDAALRDHGGATSPNGNNVSIETEMVRAFETRREHDLALAVYRSSLDILRLSIGRGR